MVSLARIRASPAAAAIPCILLLGVAACDGVPAGAGSPFVLTTRGDFVRSDAPAGIEVTLGSKLIRPADPPGTPD